MKLSVTFSILCVLFGAGCSRWLADATVGANQPVKQEFLVTPPVDNAKQEEVRRKTEAFNAAQAEREAKYNVAIDLPVFEVTAENLKKSTLEAIDEANQALDQIAAVKDDFRKHGACPRRSLL